MSCIKNTGGVAKMQQKYEPHIRVKFSLFNDTQFRTIPNKQKANTIMVFICLLKFANAKTLQCYPRKATIADMIGLSRSTIYRCTTLLEKAGIIQKKRLKSTILYTINPKYIVGYKQDRSDRHYDRSHRHIHVSDRSVLEELPYKLTRLTTFIKGLAESGSDKETILKQIANNFTKQELNQAIDNNDNPYLCKQALEIQGDAAKNYVPVHIIKNAVDNMRKKTNYFYKNKVAKNKREHGRISATKSFLSKSNKKK